MYRRKNLLSITIQIILNCLMLRTKTNFAKEFVDVGQKYRVASTKHGWMLYNLNDKFIGRSLDEYGEWSENELALFLKLIRPRDIVLDIGANIGAFTIPLAKHIGPKGKVYAFEAQRVVCNGLSANVVLNQLDNVFVYNWGIGQIDETVKIPKPNYERTSNFGGFSLKMDADEKYLVELLELRSLDSLRSSFAGCPSFIKVDIEGMELEALLGAKQLIEECYPSIYFEIVLRSNSEALLRNMEAHGYDLYWDIQPYFNPMNYYNNSNNIFPNAFSFNALAIHPSKKIEIQGYTKIHPELGKYYTHQYLISNPLLDQKYHLKQEL